MNKFFVLALALLGATPAFANESTSIAVNATKAGMVVVEGGATAGLNNMQGEFYIPVQVATTCSNQPTQAWLRAEALVEEGTPILVVSLRSTVEPVATDCERTWIETMSKNEAVFPIYAGNLKITADTGPYQGLALNIISEAGLPVPPDAK